MTLPVQFVVALRYVLDFTTPLYLSRNIASLRTSSNILRYTCLQYEITYSTAVVEFNTTMALVVLMERCNVVSAGRTVIIGFRTYIT